jgi:uncharacterized protein YndB with AHSA1/START domain/DNA-binding transcriptional ArsR family regulator
MDNDPLATLKALADPVRWKLVEQLSRGPRTTGALAGGFEQSRFGVMKHLEVLAAAGLVTVERRGRERWNHLNPVPLAAVLQALTTPLGRDWASRLLALQRAVQTPESSMTAPSMIDIHQEIRLAAPPGRVFDVLTREIDLWWTKPYRMTEGGHVTLEPRIGGELREEGPGGHVTVWGRVEEVAPGRLLVLSGTIGMQTAVAGRVRIALAAEETGTVLKLSHMAVGPIAEGAGERYTEGWSDLLGTRLRARVEAA